MPLMGETSTAFETSLDELGVTVARVDKQAVSGEITAAITEPAVGVALEETFEEAAFSLAETPVVVDPTPMELREASTGVTGATLGIGDYGSVVLSMTDRASELVSLFVERHVVVVRDDDVLPEMDGAIEALHERFNRTGGSAIIATGPSATADMGELVKGAHGPKEVHVIIVEEGE